MKTSKHCCSIDNMEQLDYGPYETYTVNGNTFPILEDGACWNFPDVVNGNKRCCIWVENAINRYEIHVKYSPNENTFLDIGETLDDALCKAYTIWSGKINDGWKEQREEW